MPLVGSEFGTMQVHLNKILQSVFNLMDFNCAENGQYNNPDLFMFLGIT
jgi:hypothetical protein